MSKGRTVYAINAPTFKEWEREFFKEWRRVTRNLLWAPSQYRLRTGYWSGYSPREFVKAVTL